MHVARIRGSHVDRQGRRRDYESRYLRRTYRDGGKVRHETLANLSGLPEQAVDAIEAALKGTPLVPAGQAVTITASLPHGHVAAVHAMAPGSGCPPCSARPAGRATWRWRWSSPGWWPRPPSCPPLAWWADTTLGADLGVAAASTDDIYAAMDWLEDRQDAIEAKLAARHLAPEANPARMALFDLSSSWLEGSRCPLAARGYSRDGKKASCRSSTGCSPTRRAARSRSGCCPATPATRPRSPTSSGLRDKFGLAKMVMVGDRGMITSARIAALNQLEDGTARPDPYGWITALRAPAIKKLMAEDGPLQLSPVRSAGPGRDHHPGLPRRAAGRLPQPGPGRRPRPQARGPAGTRPRSCWLPSSPGSRPASSPAPGRSGSRWAR